MCHTKKSIPDAEAESKNSIRSPHSSPFPFFPLSPFILQNHPKQAESKVRKKMSPPFLYSFKPVWLSALTDRVTERATDIPLVVNCGWTHILPFDFFHQWLVKKDLPFNPPTLFFFIHLVINPTSLYRLLSSNFSLCVSFFYVVFRVLRVSDS